jgi:hypothetical protein
MNSRTRLPLISPEFWSGVQLDELHKLYFSILGTGELFNIIVLNK